MKTQLEDEIVLYFIKNWRVAGERIGILPVGKPNQSRIIDQSKLLAVIKELEEQEDYYNILQEETRKLRDQVHNLYCDREIEVGKNSERKCFNCGIVLPNRPPGPIEPPPVSCSHPECEKARLAKLKSWGFKA